jgi:hypothetical protein
MRIGMMSHPGMPIMIVVQMKTPPTRPAAKGK